MSELKESKSIWQEYRVYFQANTIKGARYIDDAGKILNDYRELYDDGQVGVEGLHLKYPKNPKHPDNISVDMNRIWIACHGDTSIKRIREHAIKITKDISRIIDVKSFNRLGFRTHYFKPIQDVEEYCTEIGANILSNPLSSFIKPEQFKEVGINFRYNSPPFRIRLILQPIIIKNLQNKSDFSEDGFVIDMDIIEDKESSSAILNFDRLSRYVKEASDRTIQEVLSIISLLEEKE